MKKQMTYGEAVQDTSTKLGRAAAASAAAAKARYEKALELSEKTGRPVLDILIEMHSEAI